MCRCKTSWRDLDLTLPQWPWPIVPCPGYISETIWCRKLIFGRDIGWGLQVCNVMVWPGFDLWSCISDAVLSLYRDMWYYFISLISLIFFTGILVVAPMGVFWCRISTVKVILEFIKGFTFATSHCNRWYCITWVTGFAPTPHINTYCHTCMYGEHSNHNSTIHNCDIFIDSYSPVKKF